MIWSLRIEGIKYNQLPSAEQIQRLERYLESVSASKYSPCPNSNCCLVFSSKLREILAPEFSPPDEFIIEGADYNYMPAAYGGNYSEWEQEMKWYLDLPNDYISTNFQLPKHLSNPKAPLTKEEEEEMQKWVQELFSDDS